VIGQAPQRLNLPGVLEAWCQPPAPAKAPTAPEQSEKHSLLYRPAVHIECSVNFRSLRAGLNYSEERSYTAWMPQANLAIDWDSPAIQISGASEITHYPDPEIGYLSGEFHPTTEEFAQYQTELIDKLIRIERLRIFFNPVFGLFSAPGDDLEEFMPRIAEAALTRVEPELKRLRSRFELQLEQVREAQGLKGLETEDINTDALISRKLHFFESENRLADMFSTLAGSVFGTKGPKMEGEDYTPDEAELREDLDRIEQEASEALRTLYDEYLSLANEYDIFEIGLQPDNIQVTRCMVLWVPVAGQH
jgi:hypothetical protein